MEKLTNPLLAAANKDAFVRQLVADLGPHLEYVDRLADANQGGPPS
ncbi:hypothetical protein ACIRUY_05625 [Streptomyces erythrochromogenes]